MNRKTIVALLLAAALLLTSAAALGEAWICLSCGQTNSGNFCTECGTKKGVWVCPKCHTENEGNFCGECGAKRPEPAQAGQDGASAQSALTGEVIERGSLGSVRWELTDGGVLTVTGQGELAFDSLSDSVFCRDTRIREVYIEEGITRIAGAFYGCNHIERAVLPSTLTEIGSCSFMYCSSLREISFPAGLKAIGYAAFEGAAIREASLPEGLTAIGDDAFLSCDELEYVYVPGSVKKLPQGAFYGCETLETVVFGDGIEWVKGFSKCPGIRRIVLPPSVTVVEAYAFDGDTALEYVEIQGDSISFNGRSLSGCENLTEITFTGDVTYLRIDGNAFKDSPISAFAGHRGTEVESYASKWSYLAFRPLDGGEPAPTEAPEDDIEARFMDAINSLNCFERMRTELQGWLGVMDVYGTDGDGYSNGACVCIFDIDTGSVTLTGISGDGQWYNSIWFAEPNEAALSFALAAQEFGFYCEGLGDNTCLIYAVKLDGEFYFVETEEDAARFVETMLADLNG